MEQKAREATVILALIAVLGACTQAEAERVDIGKSGGGANTSGAADHAPQSGRGESMEEVGALMRAAKQFVKNQGGALAKAEPVNVEGVAVVVVGYHPATAEQAAECSLQVVEMQRGEPKITESTQHMLQCTTAASVESVEAAIAISANADVLTIEQQSGKGNARYELWRAPGQGWLVKRASYTYTSDNLETGEVDVIKEEAAYPSKADGVRVSEFDYSRIEKELVRHVVE